MWNKEHWTFIPCQGHAWQDQQWTGTRVLGVGRGHRGQKFEFPCKAMVKCARHWEVQSCYSNNSMYLTKEKLGLLWVASNFIVWRSLLTWFLLPHLRDMRSCDSNKRAGFGHQPSRHYWTPVCDWFLSSPSLILLLKIPVWTQEPLLTLFTCCLWISIFYYYMWDGTINVTKI